MVVPTYRRPALLERTVDALAAQTLALDRWEVVVVDDCSGPDVEPVLEALPERFPGRLRILSTACNSGPAVTRNLGWRATSAAVLAFCDDDAVPQPGWLDAGLAAFRQDPLLGVLQGRTTPPGTFDPAQVPRFAVCLDIRAATPWFESCNIFYRRSALTAVGGFDEQIGRGEDTSLGWQVVERGWHRAFSDEALAYHDIERRGPGWCVRYGWKENRVVRLAARHPSFREQAFWRPWAFRARDAEFAAALASFLVGLKWRPAWFGALPYLWRYRPSRHEPAYIRTMAETVAVDASRSLGHLWGSVRNRVLVL